MRFATALAVLLALAGRTPVDAQRPDSATNPLSISGYVTGSYVHSSQPTAGVAVGRLFDRNDGRVIGNAARVTVKRTLATGKMDLGFQIDALYGKNAVLTQSAGLNIADQLDLPQAFIGVNVPMSSGNYVQIKAGKIVTLLGVELLDDVLNSSFSHGYQFIYLADIAELGISLEARLSPKVMAQFRVTNGWDVIRANNSGKTVIARLDFTLSDAVDLAFSGYSGPEQADNATDLRHGVEFVGTFKPAKGTTLYAQFDLGGEHGLGLPGSGAHWFGAGGWGVFELAGNASLALRGEYLFDRDGARTSGVLGFPVSAGRELTSGTVTLNYRPFAHTLLRPEFRVERSSRNDFGDPAARRGTQVTIGLALSFLF